MQELPAFKEVYGKHQGEFELLSVAVDERNDPRTLVQQNGYNWLFALSDGTAQEYGVSAIPTTLFIDRSGKIVDRAVGGMDVNEFESKLGKIL